MIVTYYTTKQLAELIGVNVQTIESWEAKGHIPLARRHNGRRRFDPGVLEIAQGYADTIRAKLLAQQRAAKYKFPKVKRFYSSRYIRPEQGVVSTPK